MDVNKDAVYLGDGVYAQHDGYHVVLITETSTIYLDPYVLDALRVYVKKLNGGHDEQ